MEKLRNVLMRPVVDSPRTRRYQQIIDQTVDSLKSAWDPQRGLLGSAGIALPHESVNGFWGLPPERRAELTSAEAAEVYRNAAGRSGTAPLCIAAFCHYSPLSRHHGDPELAKHI